MIWVDRYSSEKLFLVYFATLGREIMTGSRECRQKAEFLEPVSQYSTEILQHRTKSLEMFTTQAQKYRSLQTSLWISVPRLKTHIGTRIITFYLRTTFSCQMYSPASRVYFPNLNIFPSICTFNFTISAYLFDLLDLLFFTVNQSPYFIQVHLYTF